MRQIFLSYAHLDRAEACRLHADLSSSPGIHVWFDEQDLMPGMKWRPAIRKAIRESRYFIALFSTKSVSRPGFRHSELNQALEILKEFPDDQVYLIPARLDDCEPPFDELRELTYANLFPNWETAVDRLRRSLRISTSAAKKKSMRSAPAKKSRYTTGAKQITHLKRRHISDYHYRVGLVDLRAHIPELLTLAHELNTIQTFCLFEPSSLTPSRKALLTIEGLPQLDVDGLSLAFYRKISPLKMDHVICVTNRLLAFEQEGYQFSNYLGANSPIDERVTFSSTRGLEDLADEAGVTYEVALTYGIVSDMVAYFLEVGYHDAIRGCPMDFTENHTDIANGLAKGRFCSPCSRELNKNKALKQSVNKMLHWGRA